MIFLKNVNNFTFFLPAIDDKGTRMGRICRRRCLLYKLCVLEDLVYYMLTNQIIKMRQRYDEINHEQNFCYLFEVIVP